MLDGKTLGQVRGFAAVLLFAALALLALGALLHSGKRWRASWAGLHLTAARI